MSGTKISEYKKTLKLSDLEKAAFPDHPVSLTELRKVAYAEKAGEEYEKDLVEHIEGCDYCQHELTILRHTDTVLTGEEDQQVKVLVQAAQNPTVAEAVEARGREALFASVGHRSKTIVSATAAFVGALISHKAKSQKEEEKERTSTSSHVIGG